VSDLAAQLPKVFLTNSRAIRDAEHPGYVVPAGGLSTPPATGLSLAFTKIAKKFPKRCETPGRDPKPALVAPVSLSVRVWNRFPRIEQSYSESEATGINAKWPAIECRASTLLLQPVSSTSLKMFCSARRSQSPAVGTASSRGYPLTH
jgi:hypothetical protein